MNSGEGSPCIDNYDKKYQCVLQWINTKKAEWKKIKEHYKTQNEGDDIKTFVKNILVALQPQTDVNKAIKPCGDLTKFESFCGLNGAENSKKNDDKENDVINCMLNKLQNKIHDCNKNHTQNSVETVKQCKDPPH